MQKRKIGRSSWLIGAVATLVCSSALGAVEKVGFSDLPTEVSAALNAAASSTEILSIRGVEKFDGQVLKVAELVIQKGAVLEMNSLAHPWIAIVAKRIRIVDPQAMTTIRRGPIQVLHGSKGVSGAAGTAGFTMSKNGSDGGHGSNGGNGEPGKTYDLPTVYVMTERVELASGGQPLTAAQFTFDFEGVKGGNGGDGGAGGAGGAGGKGRGPSSRLTECRRGPGGGGNGGMGADGGHGGNGANGGRGAPLVFISNQHAVDLLTASIIKNDGAPQGSGGSAGPVGPGGAGGDRARGNNLCSDNAREGFSGTAGKSGAKGADGPKAGSRGKIQAVVVAGP